MLPDRKRLAAGQRDPSHYSQPDSATLEIVIPFTSLGNVQGSIRRVERLCSDLNACIRILRTVQMPFPLELDAPSAAVSAMVAELSSLNFSLPTIADIRLCRDWKAALLEAIPLSSPVFMTYSRRLFRTPEEKIAQALRKAGYQVSLSLEEHFHA